MKTYIKKGVQIAKNMRATKNVAAMTARIYNMKTIFRHYFLSLHNKEGASFPRFAICHQFFLSRSDMVLTCL